MWACSSGHIKVLDVLLRHGVRIDTRNHSHKNAMLLATEGGHADIVKRLKQAGDWEWYAATKREAAADALASSVSETSHVL